MIEYDWHLYKNFCEAAEECGIEIESRDGSCLYLKLPKDILSKNFAMLWTPLNKVQHIGQRTDQDWEDRIREFKQNHSDFHLEFSASGDGHYYMFPEVNDKPQSDITKDDIVVCIQRMLDPVEYEHMQTLAVIKELAEDAE
jgi:hypothetical protein